jgi:hypothetical protein
MRVVASDPALEGMSYGDRTGPLVPPEAFLFQRTHHALGIGVALRVVIAGTRLLDPQETASLPKGGGRRWASVITHERQPLAASTLGELAVDGHIDGLEPILGGAPQPRIVTHDRLGRPIEDHHEVDPAHAFHHDFGHLDAPPLMGLGGGWCAPRRRPLGLQRQLWGDQEMVLPQQSQHPLVVDRLLFNDMQVSPETAIAPERVLDLEGPEAWQQLLIALDDP